MMEPIFKDENLTGQFVLLMVQPFMFQEKTEQDTSILNDVSQEAKQGWAWSLVSEGKPRSLKKVR